MKILLQFPEGLKKYALQHAEKLEKDHHEVFLCSTPTYGACDLALEEARAIHADEIVHFGHAKFPIAQSIDIPVEYVEWRIDITIEDLEHTLKELKKYKKIALATTIQHIHKIVKIKEFFKSHGIEALTKKGTLCAYEAQVLGCDSSAVQIPEAEAVLYIGDGLFHPLVIQETKPVYIFNPYTKLFKQVNNEIETLRKKRKGTLAAAISANVFGILVSTKPGQFRPEVARWANKELTSIGKKSKILIANEFNVYSIVNFGVFEAYINTACPRIIDDVDVFGKPILNPDDLEEMVKQIKQAKI